MQGRSELASFLTVAEAPSVHAWLPQNTTCLTLFLMAPAAFAMNSILEASAKMMLVSEWFTVYSTADSPNESYRGTARTAKLRLRSSSTRQKDCSLQDGNQIRP